MSEPIAPFLKYIPGFGIPKNTTPTSEEIVALRRKAAWELAKKENNIVTVNDIQAAKDAAKIAKAEKYAAFRDKEAAIRSEPRPILNQTLSPTAELLAYATPGVETLLMADDATKSFRIAGEAIKHGQVLPAIGSAVRGVGEFGLGVASVAPVVGLGVGLWNKAVLTGKFAKLRSKGAYIARLMNKALELPTSLMFNPDNMYRVIGSAGFEDAMLTGALRNNINGRSTRGVYFTQGKVNDVDNPIKGFVREDGTPVKLPLGRVYLGDVIEEVPTTHLLFNLFLARSVPEWPIFKSQNPISINSVKFYKRTSPNTYIELPHIPLMPQPLVLGNWRQFTNGFNLGYTTSGIKQTGTPTGNFHWREDITNINRPVLLDIKPDMHYTRTRTTPVIKKITNADDILLRIGIVPISNNPVLAVEQITVNPANRLVKVGERVDLTLSPNRVVQFKYQPRLVDNKGRLMSSDANRYFGIPTKTETLYTLWHKSGGTIKIKKKNRGKFTDYCGGKVTEECIRKGKNSSNPTTRKRANFAWVARHKFKHEDGGKVNYLDYFQK